MRLVVVFGDWSVIVGVGLVGVRLIKLGACTVALPGSKGSGLSSKLIRKVV